MPTAHDLTILADQPIPTWFRIGGRADRLARPHTTDDVRRCLEIDPALRVLGDGANLLVDDAGVGELVVDMRTPGLGTVEVDESSGLVRAGAGADLPRLITECVRRGLAGLEGLGGIPASVGGAIVMNAGGAFGQIADAVSRVFALRRDGSAVTLSRAEISFGYRHSGLTGLVITGAEFALARGDAVELRTKLKDVMAYKKRSQPMAANSAGCCFKNPTLKHDLEGIAPAGQRVSAGMLIDRAGLKGLRVGGAEVSPVHGNFLVTHEGARAGHVIDLMDEVARRVADRFGVAIEREVVVWKRGTP